MTAKLLPLVESPIRGYMLYSYHLAVTLTHVDAWPWFFSNFVQLQCNADQLALSDLLDGSITAKGEIHFTEGTYTFNPWLADSKQLDWDTLNALGGVISGYVVEGLRRDFYVETFIDEYHIPVLFNGGTDHFRHRLLIIGFDEARRVFDIMGFDKNSQYRQLECTYAELDAAFAGISPVQIPGRTRLLKPRAESRPPAAFDKQRFLDVLAEYLSSTNTLLNPDLRGDLKPESELWYGMRTYDFLQEYLRQWLASKAAGARTGIDFRGFNTLWEHKKCMSQRLKWLAAHGFPIPQDLQDRFAQVQTMVDAIRNRVVMCHRGLFPPGKGRLGELPPQLEAVKMLEAGILREVLQIVAGHDAESAVERS